ncbi:MAG: DUF4349 domain-containing protein [Bacteroidetes bacterium]|nr:DUF4349 domain-containing protein [Bacteroidota bacterium]
MKKYLICAVFPLTLAACKHTDPKPGTKSVQFAPPAVVSDNEVAEKKDVRLPAGDVGEKNIAADTTTANYIVMPREPQQSAIRDTAKKIIKQGDITFEARDVNVTRKALLHSLSRLGGYADEDNKTLSSDSDRKEFEIKARIPAKNFDIFMDSLSSGAVKIDSKHITISDVTVRYIDMATRLHNQKALEATYLGLLKRATRMKDVLDIEDKLTDTRTEIESEQGQMNYMSRQIAYSTIDITFYSVQVGHETGTGAGYRISAAFKEGWKLLQSLFFGLITVWPLTLIAIFAAVFVRKWAETRKTGLKAKASA